ncbi:MAG: hypothetical protein JJE47_16300 [Acidimicrobiia bacterium]|nr:hypothetical protein [Acidimicrobiia bacterium]
MAGFGTLNEKSLHAQLKQWYSEPGDQFEVPLGGFIIDMVRGDELIEIQTRNFSAMRSKLDRLTEDYSVTVVHPIAITKWLNKLSEPPTKPRRSPKRGHIFDVFGEVVYLPHLINRSNLTIEVVLIEEQEDRAFDAKKERRRRRGWVTQERRLLRVLDTHRFESVGDFVDLLPVLPGEFTTADLADRASVSRRSAQQAAYCLRKMDAITITGKQGNATVYKIAPDPT